MNRKDLIHAAKLSFLIEDDALKLEEKIRDFLQYVRDIPKTDKIYKNSEILNLRDDEIIEYPNLNTGYITLTEKKND